MKKNLHIVLILLFFLTACSAVTTTPLVPTETPHLLEATSTETSTLSPTATQTETPTPPIESLSVTQQSVNEFANAMQNAGVNVTKEQLLQQGIQIQTVTGVDGKQYEIATIHLDPDPTQQGEPLEGDYPLVIKTGGEWGKATLKEMANVKGLKIGFSVSVMNDSNSQAYKTVTENGNAVVIGDALWKIPYSDSDSTALKQGIINTDSLDRALKLAGSNGLSPMVFHLLWGAPYTLPDWLLNGNYTKEQLQDLQTMYIKTLVSKNKGKADSWVVVNEPFAGAGQQSFWLDKFGSSDEWIINAFKTASEADPQAKLILNDFGIEVPNSWLWSNNSQKNAKIISLSQKIKNDGINIEVGFQMHLIGNEYISDAKLNQLVENFKQNVKTYTGSSIPVVITEMDVNMQDVPIQNQPYILEKIYYQFVKAAIEGGITNINFFGYQDNQSWLETSLGLQEANPTLFDDKSEKKAAYYGVLKAIYESR